MNAIKPFWQNHSFCQLEDEYEGVLYTETWRKIKNLSKYWISSFGRIMSDVPERLSADGRRLKSKRKILKQYVDRCGYLRIALRRDVGGKYTFQAHVLVARAFIPNPDNKREVNHIKGIKTDNRIHQLEWATSSRNQKHAFELGLQERPIGEKNAMSSLTNAQVLEIFNSNEERAVLAEKYGVRRGTIDRIKTGELWSKVTGKTWVRREMEPEKAIEIFNNNLPIIEICALYGVSERVVSDIKKGIRFSSVTGKTYTHKYKFPTEAEKLAIRSESGLSAYQLAIKYKKGYNTIRKILASK